MKLSTKTLTLLLTLVSVPLLATSAAGESKQNSGLSDLPFKKAVQLCLMACADGPAEMLRAFTVKLVAYQMTEEKIPAMKDMIKARRNLTKAVEYTIFKDEEQFKLLNDEIVKATNAQTATPMEELLRDSRITFKPAAKKIITVKSDGTIRRSQAYDAIKKTAVEYRKQREIVNKDPNFELWVLARSTLAAYMKKFLQTKFEDFADLNAFYLKEVTNMSAFMNGQLDK